MPSLRSWKTLGKLVNQSSTTQNATSRSATTIAGIGRYRRWLLPSAFLAGVFCVAANQLSLLAQPPVPPQWAPQIARQEQPLRRSRVQAPAPQLASNGSTAPAKTEPVQTEEFSVYPEHLRQAAGHLSQPQRLPKNQNFRQPSNSYSHGHSTPSSTARYGQPVGSVRSAATRPTVAPQLVTAQTSELPADNSQLTRSSGLRENRPTHVYPEGVEVEDVEPLRVPTQLVATQELFVPPMNVPEMPAAQLGGHGGHSGFIDSPVLTIPDITVVSPDAINGQITDAPVNHETNAALWWEADLAKTILRGREPFPLTLPEALGKALTEAPELQVLHSDWFIQQIEVDRQSAAFDWITFVNAVWNRDSTPVGSQLDGAANRLRSRTSSMVAGARRLNTDGSEFELSQTIGTRNSNSDFINPNNQGTSRLAFEYDKPLLRGSGEDYNTSRITLAAIQKDTAYDRFKIGVQDHLLDVASAYWTLVLQRGRFVQSVNSWNRAKEIEQEMAKRVEVDVTPNMLDRTRSEVATRLAGAIQSEHDTFAAQDSLLRLIYGSRYPQYANMEVVTVTLPMKDGNQLTPETHIETALRTRSEVHQSIREIKTASVRYEVAANEVLPQLDMVLTGYVAGLRGNNDVGGSILNQFTEGEPGVGVGLNFEIPYRNRAANAAAEQNLIAIKRMRAQLEQTIGEVTEDVRGQVIQRNKFGTVLEQQLDSLVRTKRILQYTQKRREFLADGAQVADLYLENLLLMQNRLQDAELQYLRSQVQFSLADTALLRAISQLDTIAEGGAACAICADGGDHAESDFASGIQHAVAVEPIPEPEEFSHPSQVTASSVGIEP